MKPIHKISRRSFLGRVAGGAVGAGSFLALTGCTTLGYSDSDPYDPIGGGGGGGRFGRGGYSDADTGSYADPAGNDSGR
jgi:hypothetical protein